MKNLAGNKYCDIDIEAELKEAGIEFHVLESLRRNSEVPSAIIGYLDGWTFRRAWYYWVAKSDRSLLLFKYADPLWDSHGTDVRVAGHCGCPSPREWMHEAYDLGVNLYHVDSQAGLNALADAIRKQTKEINS